MNFRLMLLAVCTVCVAGCGDSPWHRTYIPPAGFGGQDSTPISSPHGYKKTKREETAMRTYQAANVTAWQNAAAAAIRPVLDSVSLKAPVRVVPVREDSRLQSGAAYYIAEVLRTQDFLITPDKAASQTIEVFAEMDSEHKDMANLLVRILQDGQEVAKNDVRVVIPYQTMEGEKE